MSPIVIDTRECYDYAQSRGYEPLIDGRFAVEIHLRVEIQRELFGRGHTPAENERFYRWCWEHLPHRCEECLRPLPDYSAVFVSHILTRGANPAMAHDPRNVNILCLGHHNQWENGARDAMRINARNEIRIENLRKEYQGL